MQTQEILREHPLVEQILDAHHARSRGDETGWNGYRGHVYRVLNLARALAPEGPDRDDKLAIAAAFHDLEAFTSLDYLARRSAPRTHGCAARTAPPGPTSSPSSSPSITA